MNSKENPMGRSIQVQPVLRLPKYLKLEEAKSLQHVFNITNSRNSLRNNTIIILFLNTGMRLSELSNIRINDINLKDKKINIIGKGNKERILYLNTICMKYITDYLLTKKHIRVKDYLFTNNNGKKISNATIENICLKAYKLAGLGNKGYSAHTLRHTAATYIYKTTKDIKIVQEILGHESIAKTQIYTHIDNLDLKKAVDSNPLNEFQLKIEK